MHEVNKKRLKELTQYKKLRSLITRGTKTPKDRALILANLEYLCDEYALMMIGEDKKRPEECECVMYDPSCFHGEEDSEVYGYNEAKREFRNRIKGV